MSPRRVSRSRLTRQILTRPLSIEAFDLNKVDGHETYEYEFLLDRIESIMTQKKEEAEEGEKQVKSELPVTRFLSTTKTSWVNFNSICEQIRREPQHVLDFVKAELDIEGNFGSEGNLVLTGRFKDKHIIGIFKRYVEAFVKCG